MKYNLVVLGGTFDHLHEGHKSFLRFALAQSKHIALGLTSDYFIAQYKQHRQVQSYEERRKNLEFFFADELVSDRIEIAPINSAFYPRHWETYHFEAIIVTENTKKGAEIINADRIKKELFPLKIVIVPLIHGRDEIITSSKIRAGEINRAGESYVKKEWLTRTLQLPEKERKIFHKPFGQLLTEIPSKESINPLQTITVGDVVTRDFNLQAIGQILSVIDFTVQRKKTYAQLTELGFTGRETIFSITNQAGHITPSLMSVIVKSLKLVVHAERIIIQIIGEEDLSVLPLILLLPLGFTIFYGQPQEGIVRIIISEKTKQQAKQLMEKFTYVTRGS